MAVGTRLARSSWTVFGALGLFMVATRQSIVWAGVPSVAHQVVPFAPAQTTRFVPAGPHHSWAPIVVFAVLGFLYVALGIVASRRRPAAPIAA